MRNLILSKYMDEVKNRIIKGWKSFGQLNNIFKSEIPTCLKRKVFNQFILPSLIYGCETWTNSTEVKRKLQITQRAMERQILNITKRDKNRNEWIRNQPEIKM